MSERGIFYIRVRCFLNISFPIQDVSGDRRSAGLREPGLLQQLLQMREWDSHCRGFRFKSNKITKAIHKIKIMLMIMIMNCSGMWERFALRSDACDDGRSAQLLCLHVTSPQLINIIDIVDFFSKNHHYDHYPHIDYDGCVAWLLCLLTCKLSSSKLPSYCYHKNDQTRIIAMISILMIIIKMIKQE